MDKLSNSSARFASWWRDYALAIALVAGSVLLRFALASWLGLKVPYIHFFPAILLAGWYGGFGPGAAATLLSTLAAMYFFLPPDGFAVGDRADAVSLPLFAVVGLMIAWLNHLRHAAETSQRTSAAQSTTRGERLDAVFNTTVDGIIVIDEKGTIEEINRGAVRLFGHAESEVLGRNINILMPPPHHEQHDGYLAKDLSTGEAKIIGAGREVIGRRKDGTTFPLHLSVGEFTLAGERKFTGILHDLSSRVLIEEQLRERAALARLGEMAAVIAHEVRNPLAGIRGAIQTFETRFAPESRDRLMAREIVTRIDSLNEMMKDLLLFAKPPQPRTRPTDILPLVQLTATLLKEDPKLQRLRIDVEGSPSLAAADAEMLKIVFQNLLVNGAHAMGCDGRIRVQVKTVDASCQIAFADQGPGIPRDVRERIFTPFFTTKAGGTGLGLPTAKRLIEAQNGDIWIDCPPTGGTTVTVRLPSAV